ncbi:MAG: hypothetical protein JJ896_06090 [Rhodothermales bacterium]|nr:hypothetical protein [Rhodothermales bacterium]
MILVESCCESLEDVEASIEAGADRIELCAALQTGGLTPDPELLTRAVSLGTPVMVLVRPRTGDFCYTLQEHRQAVLDVRFAVASGAAGVVVGCLTGDGQVAAEQLRDLVDAAQGRPVTFHRAFDDTADQWAAYEACAQAGVLRILTSGGAASALAGANRLRELVAADGPGILVAGGVRASHVTRLVQATGAREIHARASAIPDLIRALRNS